MSHEKESREGQVQPSVDSLGGWMNVEDDLRTGRSPLQVASDPNPQLVDVGVFTIIRRDWQRVRNGQQLGESKEVE